MELYYYTTTNLNNVFTSARKILSSPSATSKEDALLTFQLFMLHVPTNYLKRVTHSQVKVSITPSMELTCPYMMVLCDKVVRMYITFLVPEITVLIPDINFT